MVNNKVRHLEQSFVALKIRVRVEMTFRTQFARAPLTPLGILVDYSAGVSDVKSFFLLLVPFPEKTPIEDIPAFGPWNSGFRNTSGGHRAFP